MVFPGAFQEQFRITKVYQTQEKSKNSAKSKALHTTNEVRAWQAEGQCKWCQGRALLMNQAISWNLCFFDLLLYPTLFQVTKPTSFIGNQWHQKKNHSRSFMLTMI